MVLIGFGFIVLSMESVRFVGDGRKEKEERMNGRRILQALMRISLSLSLSL